MLVMSWQNVTTGMTLRGHPCSTDEKNEVQRGDLAKVTQLGQRRALIQSKLHIVMVPFSSETKLSSTLVQLFCLT